MLTIDEQLDQALAKVKALEADAQAGATLLTEAAASNTRLAAKVAELQSQKERLDAELGTVRQALDTANAGKDTLASEKTELQAQHERLDADLLTARQTIATLSKEKSDLETRLHQILARNTALEAAENDLEKRAARRAAEIVAATGTQAPAPVTPKGDRCADDLAARFKAITNPAEQTAFWRSLTPAQQAQILAATTDSKTH